MTNTPIKIILLLEGEVGSVRESAIRMFLILARRNLGPPQLAGIKKIDASLDVPKLIFSFPFFCQFLLFFYSCVQKI